MAARAKRSENRQRVKLVAVRFNEREYAALTAGMGRTGKGASTLLRETFLMADNHGLLPSLVGPFHGSDSDA